LGQSRRCAASWWDARVGVDGAPPYKGEHAGRRTDPLRARSGPNLLSYTAPRFFSDRASQDLHLSGGKRRPLEAHSTRVLWEFIGGSSPAATVEGARRWAHKCLHNKTALYRRVYLAGRQAPSSALQAGAEGLKQHSRLYSAASTTNARRFILRREGNYV
jgi:hypothetical protein